MNKNHYCIIMAGGVGSRFWPISRNYRPKQFLDILGLGKSFLQLTFDRFSKIIPKDNILIVTSDTYKDLVYEQIPTILPENLLLEPFRRNTAPCIAYATYKLLKKNPNATVVAAPSDHMITNDELFLTTVNNALKFAESHDVLMTLGIQPTRPETSYGYIQVNKAEPVDVDGNIAYKIKTFTEKPDLKLAKVFVDSGEFLWNSGLFIWNLKAIADQLEIFQPEISGLFKAISDDYYTDREKEAIMSVYQECMNISIDYAVMEKTSRAVVYPASFGWSDLGTWDSLFSYVDKDENNNYVSSKGDTLLEVKDSIVISEDNKLIVVKGLENYLIINSKDALMICPRDDKSFKSILTDLTIKDLSKYQ
ncbi:MAG TPA: mannose-1-phosphate guanylyltransferase [Rikenellaceae bacterium]|nr:mannose-1-phosphate guanylyltransferase [Rikenellaceae bacterium]